MEEECCLFITAGGTAFPLNTPTPVILSGTKCSEESPVRIGEILRGVYTEQSECAQDDNSSPDQILQLQEVLRGRFLNAERLPVVKHCVRGTCVEDCVRAEFVAHERINVDPPAEFIVLPDHAQEQLFRK